MEKVKRGDLYDEFVDKVTYLLSYKSGKPTEISFKRKNITNAFNADKRTFVDNYFNNHFNDEVNEQFLVNLVDAANK